MDNNLYKPLKDLIGKPRTYRKVARTEYLITAKKRKSFKKELQRAIRKQLGYVRRNLKHIECLQSYYAESPLTIRQGLILMTIAELYRQQKYLCVNKTHSLENLIVSISQPLVRPIMWGRANAELGTNLNISVVDCFA